MEFLRVDGRVPECGSCNFKDISEDNDRALSIYNLACPCGELDYKGIEMAFTAFGIRGGAEKKQYLKKIVKIHRMIKEHYAEKGS
jgi:hypothetical protein